MGAELLRPVKSKPGAKTDKGGNAELEERISFDFFFQVKYV